LKVFERLGFLRAEQLRVVHAAREFGIRRASATSLPFRDGTVGVIYSSHMLEHLDREETRRFLAEAHRVLCAGGWIRLVVPDLQHFVREYQRVGDADAFLESLRLSMSRERGRKRLIQHLAGFRGHRWMYDAASFARLLESSGFTDVAVVGPGETSIPEVGELDLREREDESIYAEARKP
jgi:predicted SAM-dependent methyltransferase